jgi:glycine/D-amino acid oxidase-like deaminating enzyme
VTPDVLVVGGGIVGCAVASACAQRGLAVQLVERGALAGGASSLPLALLGRPVPAELEEPARASIDAYLALHHFTGRAFFLDRSPLDCDGADALVQRIDVPGATLALSWEARAHRAQIQTGCDVKSLLTQGRTVRGVRTDAGELRARTTVVAAGADSWRVCRALPLHVPVTDVEGICGVYPPGTLVLERPVLDDGAWAAPDHVGRLFVAEPERLARLGGALSGRQPLERRVIRYGTTADGLPLHGPLPGVEGLLLACGHGALGVALAPATGSAIAAIVAREEPDGPFLPERLFERAG